MGESDRPRDELMDELVALRERVAQLEALLPRQESLEVALREGERAEREFSDRLAALIEITNELSISKSVDELCRRAVELARQHLGFERLGIWFRTEEPDVLAGSFGVDRAGHVCDERQKRSRIDPDTPEGHVLLSKEPLVFWGDAPLVDSAGHIIGRGEQVFAPIWDGQNVIGHVSMDNRMSCAPITQRQCELLRLFSSRIGYLITRKRAEDEREHVIRELKEALAKIKTLHGLIPICASCKKIRDDQGYWCQVEEYVREHSDADFSHGICPECARRLYPELMSEDEATRTPKDDR